MSVDYIGTGNDDGVDFGQASTTKIGFYGLTTPIARAVLTLAGSSTATIPADITYIKAFLIKMNLAVSA